MPNQDDSDHSPEELAANLISVTEASRISGMTTAWISRLIKRGDIAGVRVGRIWLTTEAAVREYLNQDRKPGPKTE